MFSLSEIIFLVVLALLVIGPKQLPEVARQIARFLNEMKRASASLTEDFKIDRLISEKKDNDDKRS
jgi:sec-independent protein translocase protein TatB